MGAADYVNLELKLDYHNDSNSLVSHIKNDLDSIPP
jgi:hypothetical protein